MSEAISQETLDEAAIPELTDDAFSLNGKTVKIMPLKIKYQKQFAKAFEPIVDSVVLGLSANEQVVDTNEQGQMIYRQKTFHDFTPADFMRIASAFLSNVEVAGKLIQILCHNDGYTITDEELDESTITLEEIQAILVQSFRKGGELHRKIADFFEYVLNAGNEMLNTALASVKNPTESETTENTAS